MGLGSLAMRATSRFRLLLKHWTSATTASGSQRPIGTMPLWVGRGEPCASPLRRPGDKVAVAGNVPPQPTEDFLGWDALPSDRACIRWYIMFRYPLGVRPEEGEDWFLNVHAPEVMQQPGLRRFFSTKLKLEPIPLAGTWSPNVPMNSDPPMVQFDRTMELWYDSLSAWKNAVIDNPPTYTKPEWSSTPGTRTRSTRIPSSSRVPTS